MHKCGGWGTRWQQAWNGGTGEPCRHRSGRSAQAWASAAQEAPRDDRLGCQRSEGHRGQHSLRSCGPGAYEKIVASPKVIINTSVTYTGLDTKSMAPFVTTPLRFFGSASGSSLLLISPVLPQQALLRSCLSTCASIGLPDPQGSPGRPFPSLSAAAAKSLQSCPTLWDPIDGSPPGSPIPGIPQARTLEWVAISFPMHESEK